MIDTTNRVFRHQPIIKKRRMRKGQLRIAAALLSLAIITAALLMMPRQRRPSTARAETGAVLASPVDVPTQQSGFPRVQTDALARLPSRPSANTASRNDRRSGFAWILRQLGASEELLDRLADGDL